MVTTGAGYTGLRAVIDYLYHLCLPVIVMVFAGLGGLTRYVRGALLDALSMDYVRTARAKGLREKTVIYKHVLSECADPDHRICGWIHRGDFRRFHYYCKHCSPGKE